MNIVYVAPIRLPTERAHGYATMKLCEEFARAGHEVTLIVPSKWAPALKEKDPFKFYDIEQNFKLTRIGSTDLLGAKEGRGSIAFWIDMLSFVMGMKMRAGIILANADVVYLRDFRLVPFLPKEKLMLEVHDIPPQVARFVTAVKTARKVVTISHGLKNKIAELTGRDDVLVAPDAVDLAKFEQAPSQAQARQLLNLPFNKKIVLYAGHFYDWKGADVFAAAAASMPNVYSVLVGGVEPDYERLLEQYKHLANIEIISFQHPSRMPLYLAAADVLVLPNKSTSEISSRYTSPLKLFEYMAAGKPIVASDLPSIREILDESTAILVKPDDSEALANGIKKALTPDFQKLAQVAKEKVKSYTWPSRAHNILSAIS
jgi:glycosyltransferase involved in cell wall biosynthesis